MSERLSEVDRLSLLLAHERLDHAVTQERMIQMSKVQIKQELENLMNQFSKKYGLSDRDTVDIRNGSIVREIPPVEVIQFPKKIEE